MLWQQLEPALKPDVARKTNTSTKETADARNQDSWCCSWRCIYAIYIYSPFALSMLMVLKQKQRGFLTDWLRPKSLESRSTTAVWEWADIKLNISFWRVVGTPLPPKFCNARSPLRLWTHQLLAKASWEVENRGVEILARITPAWRRAYLFRWKHASSRKSSIPQAMLKA